MIDVPLEGRYLNSETEAKMIRALLERAESENIERHHSPSPKAAPRLSLEKNLQIVALYEDGWKPSQIAERRSGRPNGPCITGSIGTVWSPATWHDAGGDQGSTSP